MPCPPLLNKRIPAPCSTKITRRHNIINNRQSHSIRTPPIRKLIPTHPIKMPYQNITNIHPPPAMLIQTSCMGKIRPILPDIRPIHGLVHNRRRVAVFPGRSGACYCGSQGRCLECGRSIGALGCVPNLSRSFGTIWAFERHRRASMPRRSSRMLLVCGLGGLRRFQRLFECR